VADPLTIDMPTAAVVVGALVSAIVVLYRASAARITDLKTQLAQRDKAMDALVERVRHLEDARADVQQEQAQRYHDLVLKQLASQHALTEVLKAATSADRTLARAILAKPCLMDLQPTPARSPTDDETAPYRKHG
jgi:multidrug resistance efflux pump